MMFNRQNEFFNSREGVASSSDDINILLLGPTGVGKTTFINAFANYLVYDTLNDAMNGELQAPITASFVHLYGNEFDEYPINIGEPDNDERNVTGESCTRICRSFVFNINGKKLRLIDTPGIGDTRGVLKDEINFADILAYIDQFQHLNGICILLKPNESRLNILIRYCVKELLRHLHINARNNITFVFTNARSTSFKIGESAPILRKLIGDIQNELQAKISFTMENTFLLDNEAFRFLALNKNGIESTDDDINDYKRSWNYTIKEFQRLVAHIIKCEKHCTHDFVSLNKVQQLIRKFTRPIGEVTTLIQANMRLAEQYKDSISLNSAQSIHTIPQMDATIEKLDYPRTVCTNKKCTKISLIDGIYKIEYVRHCHRHCYLSGVEKEYIGHKILRQCDAMDKATDKCRKCGCDRKEHMHITYELRKFMRNIIINVDENGNATNSTVNKFIEQLNSEKTEILKVCSQIAYFLRMNSLNPINDDILEYIEHFIEEEGKKKDGGARNDKIIADLKQLKEDYQKEIECFQEAMEFNQSASSNSDNTITPEKILKLVESLYRLPINGLKIKSQVEHLGYVQQKIRQDREKTVDLAENSEHSAMMNKLQGEFSQMCF